MRLAASLLLIAGCSVETGGLAETAPQLDAAAPPDTGLDASAFDAGPPPPTDAGPPPDVPAGVYASCEEIRIAHPGAVSGAYVIDQDGPSGGVEPFAVYCDIRVGRAWTLLMKMDGNQSTFEWGSMLWTNDRLLVPESVDLSRTEAKLRGFDSIPFTAMRLVMETDGMTRVIELEVAAGSLLELFSGAERPIAAGRAVWETLVPSPQLLPYCPTSGVNIDSGCCAKVRLGIVANGESDCDTPDSVIGFGIRPYGACDGSFATTVGNGATCITGGPYDTRSFGWIFVR